MKRSFPVLALAGALLIGTSALPALAQSKAHIVNDPSSIAYSWGVIHAPADGPQMSYTWDELKLRPAANASAPASAQSKGINEGFVPGPEDVVYSWGVIHAPQDGPQTSYTWDELKRWN